MPRGSRWQDRNHFLGIAAKLMRRVLVDHARPGRFRSAAAIAVQVALDESMASSRGTSTFSHWIGALESLAAWTRKAPVVERRFFGGLTVEEIGRVLDVSADTVKRDWRLAKLWLLRELRGDGHE